jgi:hypothetical protein
MRRDYKIAAAIVVAVLGPLIVTCIYLALSRGPERWFTGQTDTVALSVAVASGIVGLLFIPLKPWYRVAVILLYIPAMGALLIPLALLFVCGMFGDCL